MLPLAILVILLVSGSNCDEIRPINNDAEAPIDSEKVDLIRDYFSEQFIYLDDSLGQDFYNRYGDDVLEAMKDCVDHKDDYFFSRLSNKRVNSRIFERAAKSNPDNPDKIALEALDLIVPNSQEEPIYEKAKNELRKFHEEQPSLASQILERLTGPLQLNDLHTMDAIEFLEGVFYNWIPLGRMGSFINENAE